MKKPYVNHQLCHSLANEAINWPIKTMNSRSKNQEIMEFGVLGFSNNEIGILLYQNEAEKINKAIESMI